MASVASPRARSPQAAASGGPGARPYNAAGPRAARPHRQRPQALTITLTQEQYAAAVRPGWRGVRLAARYPAALADDQARNRFERAAADLLRSLEDSGGRARVGGTFVLPLGPSHRLVSIRFGMTDEKFEELQRRLTPAGWVDLNIGGRDPAWPGFAAVSTDASEGEREVLLTGLPTGFSLTELASRLRDAQWPISRSYRPTHPILDVKRDDAVAIVVPADFDLPKHIMLEVQGGQVIPLQVRPESKLPPAPHFPGLPSASWAAVAAGGAPGAPRSAPVVPAGPAAPTPCATASAGPAAGAGTMKNKRSKQRRRSRSRSVGAGGAADALNRGRSRSRSPEAAAAGPLLPQGLAGQGRDGSRSRSRDRSPPMGLVLPAATEGSSAGAGGEGGQGFQQVKKPRRRSPGASRSRSVSPPHSPNRFALLEAAAAAAEVAAASGEAADDAMTDG